MSYQREPDKTHHRAIFLSDIHLGTRGCQADLLVAFLKLHTCERLYLVGDIVDGWRLKSTFYWPQAHTNVMRRILTLAKRGTKVIYVTGNHDEFLRRYSDLELGNLKLVNRAEHLAERGERLLVIHGDEYDVVTRYHRWLAFAGDVGYTLLLKLNRVYNQLRARFGRGYWSLSAWAKQRVKRAVSYVSDFEGAVAHHCRRQGFDGVVCGHIHHAEIRDLEGVRYMNCGDWVESCTALVETMDGEFRIVHWADEIEMFDANVLELFDVLPLGA
jgi:UDP-2,3-diacylglucosamine pyrophosphatase LpxH